MSDIQIFRAWGFHDMALFPNLHEKKGRTGSFGPSAVSSLATL